MKRDLENKFLSIWHDESARLKMTVEEPEREVQFHPCRKWRLDFAWPRMKIGIEIDGGSWVGGRHNTPMGSHMDRTKHNAACECGWTVLRYDGQHLKDDPSHVFEQIIRTMCAVKGESKPSYERI